MLRRRVLRFFYLRTDNEYLEAFHEPFTQFWKRTWNFNDDPKGNSDANPQVIALILLIFIVIMFFIGIIRSD